MVDDHDIRSIGEFMPNLVELNAGKDPVESFKLKQDDSKVCLSKSAIHLVDWSKSVGLNIRKTHKKGY